MASSTTAAREHVAEKVAALDLGADDYLTKPSDTEELLARIRTALRQLEPNPTRPTLIQKGSAVGYRLKTTSRQ